MHLCLPGADYKICFHAFTFAGARSFNFVPRYLHWPSSNEVVYIRDFRQAVKLPPTDRANTNVMKETYTYTIVIHVFIEYYSSEKHRNCLKTLLS